MDERSVPFGKYWRSKPLAFSLLSKSPLWASCGHDRWRQIGAANVTWDEAVVKRHLV